jgi:hypothetical protein
MVGTFGKGLGFALRLDERRAPGRDGHEGFDFEYFELWAAQFGIDYEIWTRDDQEHVDEPREQHARIFGWTQTDGETIESNGQARTMGQTKTPRTFVEIDEAGLARLMRWNAETTFDVLEWWVQGPAMTFKTREQGNEKVDGRKLLSREKQKSWTQDEAVAPDRKPFSRCCRWRWHGGRRERRHERRRQALDPRARADRDLRARGLRARRRAARLL